jgi:hypothetical protein
VENLVESKGILFCGEKGYPEQRGLGEVLD